MTICIEWYSTNSSHVNKALMLDFLFFFFSFYLYPPPYFLKQCLRKKWNACMKCVHILFFIAPSSHPYIQHTHTTYRSVSTSLIFFASLYICLERYMEELFNNVLAVSSTEPSQYIGKKQGTWKHKHSPKKPTKKNIFTYSEKQCGLKVEIDTPCKNFLL